MTKKKVEYVTLTPSAVSGTPIATSWDTLSAAKEIAGGTSAVVVKLVTRPKAGTRAKIMKIGRKWLAGTAMGLLLAMGAAQADDCIDPGELVTAVGNIPPKTEAKIIDTLDHATTAAIYGLTQPKPELVKATDRMLLVQVSDELLGLFPVSALNCALTSDGAIATEPPGFAGYIAPHNVVMTLVARAKAADHSL